MRLTDEIHLLRIDFEIPISPEKRIPRYVNVILIFCDRITIIDTGVKGSEKIIFDYIKNQNRDYMEIDSILLSHSHPDHIGSAADIKSLTGCKVSAHEQEKDWIGNINEQNRQRPVPGFFDLVQKSVTLDEFLKHNQELEIRKGLTIKIIKSPGHSKGTLNFLFVEDKILFTADSIPLKNDIPNYDNYLDLAESLEMIKSNPEYNILLTSWTPPISDPVEIEKIINEGTEYIRQIDIAVNTCYKILNDNPLENCRKTIEMLGLPPIFVNHITDRAFRSHLNMNSARSI